ncbi:MAG: hypothetical protein QM776_09330 [Rhodocyclaceae bacterium]
MKRFSMLLVALLSSGLFCLPSAQAEDVIQRFRVSDVPQDRVDYNLLVITEAMQRTVKQYGPWRIENFTDTLARERVLAELESGERFNTAVFVTQPSWEEKLIPVRIPVDLGLTGFRVSLVNRKTQPILSAIRTEAALKQLSLTAGVSWSSRKVLEALGFNVQPGTSQQAMLAMLMAERVDLFPRGLNEAVQEYEFFRADYPDLAIEQSLLIYVPLPTYFFVSPKTPRLAERLRTGLESMVKDGSLARLVRENNAALIASVDFCKRRVFRFDNPLLTSQSAQSSRRYWLDPRDPKTGLCHAVEKTARKR